MDMNNVVKGTNLEIKSGLVFFLLNLPLVSSPNDKMLPSFKRVLIYLLNNP